MAVNPAAIVRSVEFFGLPGSGKTTVSRELLGLLRASGLKAAFSGDRMGDGKPLAQRTLHRLALVARETPPCLRTSYRGTRLIWSRSEGLNDRLHSMWNFLSVEAMANQQLRGRELLVLDQGPVQAIWSARMREAEGGTGSPWAALVREDWLNQCLFVQVECGIDIALQRLSARQERTSRMQRPDRQKEMALWAKGAALVTELGGMLEAALRRKSLERRRIIVRTDSGTSSHGIAEILLKHLQTSD